MAATATAASSTATRVPRERTQSLNDVRAIIPESCFRRSTTRGVLAVAQAFVLWAVPVVALAFTDRWWAVGLLWILAGLGVSGMFVIGHDASHGALVESRGLGLVLARLCMAPSAHVESAWDLGHNRIHHGYTTREGFDFVWHPVTVEQYGAMGRLARLQHRLEWSFLGSGAYFLRSVWWQKMWRFTAPGKRHADILREKIVLGFISALVLAGAAVWGAFNGGVLGAVWMPVKLFVVPCLIFMHVMGWAVYVHHVGVDIKWWQRKDWTQFHGQMDSTTILHLPRLINRLWFHNIMVHVPHHVDTRIPFTQLPAAAKALQAAYPDTVRSGKYSSREYVRTTRACKLYDFEAGRWLPYSAARSLRPDDNHGAVSVAGNLLGD